MLPKEYLVVNGEEEETIGSINVQSSPSIYSARNNLSRAYGRCRFVSLIGCGEKQKTTNIDVRLTPIQSPGRVHREREEIDGY